MLAIVLFHGHALSTGQFLAGDPAVEMVARSSDTRDFVATSPSVAHVGH